MSIHTAQYEEFILTNMKKLVNDKILSDVIFIVEDEQMCGIKSIFAANSSYFRAMLYGSVNETHGKEFKEVKLTNITVPAFKWIRNSFYCPLDNDLTPYIVVDVLFASGTYGIQALTTNCIQFIKQIEDLSEWFIILNKFDEQPQPRAKLYLNQILNQGDSPYIMKYRGLKLVEHSRFKYLKRETTILLLSSLLQISENETEKALIRAFIGYVKTQHELEMDFTVYNHESS
eukprot:95886_1